MRYPALLINREKLLYNVKTAVALCREQGIDICAVTKAYCANPEIVSIVVEGGVDTLADARIQNLKKLVRYPSKKMMLRLPMLSEAGDVVELSDISLNSELKTIKALSLEAQKRNIKHGVILMVEMGDLREGVLPKDIMELAGSVLELPGVELVGLGANFNCYGGIIPTPDKLSSLVLIADDIRNRYKIPLSVVSGGGSGVMYMVKQGTVPAGINHLRLGESILLGCDVSYHENIGSMHTDIFTFRGEIVEIKYKPSVPAGESGPDAFGGRPVFPDKGIIRRAIVACGRQDVAFSGLQPLDKDIEILGASSDHLILEIHNENNSYEVGTVVDFAVDYGALLAACTSEYVSKVVI